MAFLQHTLEHEFNAEPHSLELDSRVRMELLQAGVLRVSPAHSYGQYRVLISSGIHGNETAPMEIVDQLITEIKSGVLSVNNELLFVIGNPPAANKALRFIDENLNRLFSSEALDGQASYESRRATQLINYTRDFFEQGDQARLHYDLHTAIRGSYLEKFAVYPFLHERPRSEQQLGFLEACGLEAILLSNKPSKTYSYFTSTEFGADAFTVELGSVKPFGENDMSEFAKAIHGLRGLIAGEERFEKSTQHLQVFSVVEEVIKLSDDLRLHIPHDAKNFTQYSKGQLLASDGDYQYETQRDGERFVFPIANVPIGERAMLVVAPTKLIEQENQ